MNCNKNYDIVAKDETINIFGLRKLINRKHYPKRNGGKMTAQPIAK